MKLLNLPNQTSRIPSSINVPLSDSKPKLWLKPTDQMDSWLDSQGFYRKHIARDASSLFRCVSELVFLTQVHHLNVRKHCIQFALNQSEVFKKLTKTSIKEYVERLSNPREWGTTIDMEVMSLIYRLDFALYKEMKKPVEKVTSNGFRSCIVLSLSYEHHYDSVYPKQHIINAAICQSILYEMLYKCVFKLEEVDYAVNKMLHDKTTRYQTELNMALFSTGFQMRLEMRDTCRNVKDLLNCGITPFPYKVAKSLDPNIYRNVEYDTWNEQRKGLKHGLMVWNNKELQIGSKCLVNFSEKNMKIKRHGYIQQMSANKGPAVVFVEGLGEKITVPYDSLELIPVSSNIENHLPVDSLIADTVTYSSSKEKANDAQENVDDFNRDIYQSASLVDKSYNLPNTFVDSCNVHCVYPTTTAIPTTCYACVTSHAFQSETSDVRPTQVILHSSSSETCSKGSCEITAADNRSAVRMVCNNSVDSYLRYGCSPYPSYCVAPSVIYSTQPDQSGQSNADVSRTHYSPGAYPLTQTSNELLYALPVPNISNKSEMPPYSAPVVYPSPLMKKSSPQGVSNVTDYSNVELQMYHPKDVLYIKDPSSIVNSSFVTMPPNIYPVIYPSYSPSVYYHSYDYCTSCPDLQSYEFMTTTYQPQVIRYPDDPYQPNSAIYCQPLLSSSHDQ